MSNENIIVINVNTNQDPTRVAKNVADSFVEAVKNNITPDLDGNLTVHKVEVNVDSSQDPQKIAAKTAEIFREWASKLK